MNGNVLMHSAHITTHEELLAATSLVSAPPIRNGARSVPLGKRKVAIHCIGFWSLWPIYLVVLAAQGRGYGCPGLQQRTAVSPNCYAESASTLVLSWVC